MTIVEALKLSRASDETGEEAHSFMRVKGGGGFVRWWPGWTYELAAEAGEWIVVELNDGPSECDLPTLYRAVAAAR